MTAQEIRGWVAGESAAILELMGERDFDRATFAVSASTFVALGEIASQLAAANELAQQMKPKKMMLLSSGQAINIDSVISIDLGGRGAWAAQLESGILYGITAEEREDILQRLGVFIA